MNSIHGLGNSSAVQRLLQQPLRRETPPAGAGATSADSVEFSSANRLLDVLRRNDIRADKVAAVRAEIEADTYETPDKVDIAASRLLDELAR